MTKGGARNRSGPQADPASGRSDRRGFSLDVLPAEGYSGKVPEFPLQQMRLFVETREGSGREWTVVREFDEEGTEAFNAREAELWSWAWGLPQAAAWSREPWRWHSVAMWVRTAVVCEGAEAQAADKNSLHRFADQIGMTPAGLRENGWKIATDEVAEKRDADPQADARAEARALKARLSVVADGSGG